MTTRTKVVSAAFIAVAIGGAVAAYETVGPVSQARARVQTATVQRGSVLSTVSASGNVQAADNLSLDFKTGGTLVAVDVKPGQHVRAGQALAKIDPTSAEATLRTAHASLLSAEANLQTLEQGLTPQEVSQNKIGVKQAQLSVSQATASLADSIASAALDRKSLQAAVSQARASLAQAQRSATVNEQALQVAIDQAKQTAAASEKSLQGQVNQAKIALDFARANSGGSATSAQGALDQANAQLQADQTRYNLDTGNLNGVAGATDGAKDSLQNAQAAVTNDNLQIQKIKEYQITYSCTSTCQYPWDPLTLSQLQYRLTADQQVVTYWNSIVSDQAAVTKDGQSVASAQHSLDTNAVSNQQSITNAGSAYTNAVRSLEKAKISDAQSIQNAEQALQKAKVSDAQSIASAHDQLNSALTSLQSGLAKDAQTVQSSRSSLRNAQVSLASTLAGNAVKAAAPTAGSVAQAQASIASAQAAYQNAQDALEQTTLTAPVAGTIAAVNAAVGEDVGSGGASSSGSSSSSSSTSFMTLTNVDRLQVTAGFGESDAAKIRVGQPVTIQVAALPNVELAAHVIGLDTNSTLVSNVVTYYATLQLDNKEPGLKPGMTVTASVIVGRRDNVLHVPNAAVRGSGANAVATVVDAKGNQQSVSVVAGLQGDDSTEIVSGLKAGQQVVVSTGTATLSTGTNGGFGGGGVFRLRGGLGG